MDINELEKASFDAYNKMYELGKYFMLIFI